MRRGVKSRGFADRTKRRRGLRRDSDIGGRAQENSRVRSRPGQLNAPIENYRVYAPRTDGSILFEPSTRTLHDFRIYPERRSSAAIVNLLGRLPAADRIQ